MLINNSYSYLLEQATLRSAYLFSEHLENCYVWPLVVHWGRRKDGPCSHNISMGVRAKEEGQDYIVQNVIMLYQFVQELAN